MKGFLFSVVFRLSHHCRRDILVLGGWWCLAFKTKAQHLSCCKIGKEKKRHFIFYCQATRRVRLLHKIDLV